MEENKAEVKQETAPAQEPNNPAKTNRRNKIILVVGIIIAIALIYQFGFRYERGTVRGIQFKIDKLTGDRYIFTPQGWEKQRKPLPAGVYEMKGIISEISFFNEGGGFLKLSTEDNQDVYFYITCENENNTLLGGFKSFNEVKVSEAVNVCYLIDKDSQINMAISISKTELPAPQQTSSNASPPLERVNQPTPQQTSDFPKINTIYVNDSWELAEIPEYTVFYWNDTTQQWEVKGDNMILGHMVKEQLKFHNFYIIRSYAGAHGSILVIIVPKAKKIFYFSTNTPDLYADFDFYNKYGVFKVTAKVNDYKPSYAEGTESFQKWQWEGDTFKFLGTGASVK